VSGRKTAAGVWPRSGHGGRGIHSPVENPGRVRSLAARGRRYSAYAACQHGEARITWCFWFQRDPAGEAAGRLDKPVRRRLDRARAVALKPGMSKKKRPLAVCKRPKSREETPKEGGGNATQIALPRCNNMPPRRTKGKRGWHIFAESGATRRRIPGRLEAAGRDECGLLVERRAQAVRRRHRGGRKTQPEAARVVP
jgi:hypothetical protein